jgi:hypothetical protein
MKPLASLPSVLVAALLLLLSPLSPAAGNPRVFEIELLIFQNLTASDDGEVWPADYPGMTEQGETPATVPEQLIPAGTVSWLPADRLRLKRERAALATSAQYRPLGYLAWRQTLQDRDQAQPMPVEIVGKVAGARVDGTVRVAVERYLHLYLDLTLHLPVSAASDVAPAIELKEHRRMRSGELHYLDNPRFGVIALITPVETSGP